MINITDLPSVTSEKRYRYLPTTFTNIKHQNIESEEEREERSVRNEIILAVTFCKTDTPEIHDPLGLLDFWHKCVSWQKVDVFKISASFLIYSLSYSILKNASTFGQIAVFTISVISSDIITLL